uniref:Uncharacterized protein n=1 Tax=Octopus bimaculoides TaxID=37653 RepID=A0A0L8IAZ2_OCTBM
MKPLASKPHRSGVINENRGVIKKLIDRAQTKKMLLEGQKTNFYRIHALLEATVQRLNHDLHRLDNLERRRLHSKLSYSDSSSIRHASSSSEDSVGNIDSIDSSRQSADDEDHLGIAAFFNNLKKVKVPRNYSCH